MMGINEKWIFIAIFVAIFLYILISSGKEGFQNPSQQKNDSVNKEICSIMNDTYAAMKSNFDGLDKDDQKAAVVAIHMKGIKDQMDAQGC